MHPVLFTFTIQGHETVVGTYGLFMIAGFLLAVASALYISGLKGYRPGEFFNYVMIIVACVIAGAFIAGFFIFLPERMARGFFDYPAALVSWGGILGGIAAAAAISLRFRENFLYMADIIAPGCLAGMGIGRIGCFFAGCCYGIHTDSCLGASFTDPISPASAMRQPLVPTQLLSAAFLILAGAVFFRIVIRNKLSGASFAASAIVYSLFRFTIEFWRDDPRLFLFGLSDGQMFSILYFICGIGILTYLRLKKNEQA